MKIIQIKGVNYQLNDSDFRNLKKELRWILLTESYKRPLWIFLTLDLQREHNDVPRGTLLKSGLAQ